MNSDILWAIGFIVFGAVILVFFYKKGSNEDSLNTYRLRLIISGIGCIIWGLCMIYRIFLK